MNKIITKEQTERIVELIKATKMIIPELAEKIGVNVSTINRWRRGETLPSLLNYWAMEDLVA